MMESKARAAQPPASLLPSGFSLAGLMHPAVFPVHQAGIAACRSRSAEHWGCSSSLLTCVDWSFLTNEVRQTQSSRPCKSFIFIENICIRAFVCCCCSGRGCKHHLPPGGLPTVTSSWGNLKKLPVSNLKGNRLFFSLELSLMLYIRGFLEDAEPCSSRTCTQPHPPACSFCWVFRGSFRQRKVQQVTTRGCSHPSAPHPQPG